MKEIASKKATTLRGIHGIFEAYVPNVSLTMGHKDRLDPFVKSTWLSRKSPTGGHVVCNKK